MAVTVTDLMLGARVMSARGGLVAAGKGIAGEVATRSDVTGTVVAAERGITGVVVATGACTTGAVATGSGC